MDDPVADILRQRAAMHGGAAAAVVVSLLAHAGLSAVAIVAAMHRTTTQTPAVMNIRFAKIPAAPVEDIRPRLSTPPASVAVDRGATQKPIVAAKPVAKPVAASPYGKSMKKAAEPVPVPASAPPTSTQPQIAVGGAGVTGLEGGDFPYTIYIDNMKRLIGTRWLRPQVADGATTTVYFVIERDGTLRDAKTEVLSGNGTFDRAALRAVLESSPLPPLPFAYSGTYLGVHLTFR